jgi:hypothetical protein
MESRNVVPEKFFPGHFYWQFCIYEKRTEEYIDKADKSRSAALWKVNVVL